MGPVTLSAVVSDTLSKYEEKLVAATDDPRKFAHIVGQALGTAAYKADAEGVGATGPELLTEFASRFVVPANGNIPPPPPPPPAGVDDPNVKKEDGTGADQNAAATDQQPAP